MESYSGKNTKIAFFSYYFLNMDISLNINFPLTKFDMLILHDIMEGTLSQIFNLGPSFYFYEFYKIKFHKMTKGYPFFGIK